MTHTEIIETLKENRDSIISEIRYCFRNEISRGEETLKSIMEKVAEYAEANQVYFSEPKRMKTNMRNMVKKIAAIYHREKKEQENLRLFGSKKPSIAEMQAVYEMNEGIRYNHATRQYENI